MSSRDEVELVLGPGECDGDGDEVQKHAKSFP